VVWQSQGREAQIESVDAESFKEAHTMSLPEGSFTRQPSRDMDTERWTHILSLSLAEARRRRRE
jgi:hypothetical protein